MAAQYPPNDTVLQATGAVVVYKLPGVDHWNYIDDKVGVGLINGEPRFIPANQERDYRAGDPLGKSLGSVLPGPDGESYLKIECFQWHLQKAALFFDDWSRQYHVGYLKMADRDQTWVALTPDGRQTADALGNLVATFKATVLEGYLALGIPEPVDYSLVTEAGGAVKLYLTFKNGFKVDAGKFDALTLAEKLAYVVTPAGPGPGPGPGGTMPSLWLIIAGAGMATLLGVVILVQYQKRRRRQQS